MIRCRIGVILIFACVSTLMQESREYEIARIYPCNSMIYCQGPILEAVNRLRLFPDSKTFVDMPLKTLLEEEALDAFESRFPNASNIKRNDLIQFVTEYFSPAGHELLHYDPVDWKSEPCALKSILDSNYRKWAMDLNLRWKILCKKMNHSVAQHPYTSSIIYLPHEFVIPGGRFREAYYWDAYWIILGLLHSGMTTTTKAMLDNYLYLINRYGFIPNGGRVYYLKRSQPPFMTLMAKAYYDFTGNQSFLHESLPVLEKEMENFWRVNRSMQLQLTNETYTVYHYSSLVNTPRPESYREDFITARNLPQEDEANLYSNLASAAESGWDFSSRWIADHTTFRLQKTRLVLPVDLNAFICGNYKILADLNRIIGNKCKAEQFERTYNELKSTMMKVFYNETTGVWFDYHLDIQKHNQAFYPSNLSPLFTGCYDFTGKSGAMDKIFYYLKGSKALLYSRGIVTSLMKTGQQWDMPNAWPPLVHMLVIGLDKTGDKRLQSLAQQIAQRWTRLNYDMYKKTTHMFEKYDVVSGDVAKGGEYEVQEGFGWTNGVIIDFLVKYSSKFIERSKFSRNMRDIRCSA